MPLKGRRALRLSSAGPGAVKADVHAAQRQECAKAFMRRLGNCASGTLYALIKYAPGNVCAWGIFKQCREQGRAARTLFT